MTREELSTFAAGREAAWDHRDPVKLAAGHALDGVVESPIFGRIEGRPAIETTYRNLFDIFDDWDFHGDELIVEGDRVAEPFTARATHSKDFLGIPGTGRRFQIHGVLLFEFHGTLIAREQRIYDFSGMLIQIGVLKAKPGK
jgi:hypothetical protein